MDLTFYKMCPSGNTTILISEPQVPVDLRAPMANILMDPLHLQAEQVAYVDMDATPPRIAMMGGEFCGNACRSLAAMLSMRHGTTSYEATSHEGVMLSSGAEAPVPYRVTRAEDGSVNAAIRMPNKTMPAVSFVKIDKDNAPIVHLDGIDHLLLDESAHPRVAEQSAAQTDQMVRGLLAQCGLLESVAAGCIWYKHDAVTGACAITPFVHVRETKSLYAETACGSGTLAVALFLAGMTQNPSTQNNEPTSSAETFTLDVVQPSGMTITATCTQHAGSHGEGKTAATKAWPEASIDAWIGGTVTSIAKGITTVTL